MAHVDVVSQHDSKKPGAVRADQVEKSEQVSLRGTFVSVMILGGFLALTWLLVFVLFLARN